MSQDLKSLTQLIREIRTCFNQLKALSEKLNSGLGVNPSMRAVLEGLDAETGRTVPDLANERGVSRQHVQTVMNALLDENLVRVEENPEHKRSVLYLLTPEGTQTFEQVRKREADPMFQLASALPEAGTKQARDLIKLLNEHLKSQIEKET
jgi:DNA-binding MarR family transcriptional regulator